MSVVPFAAVKFFEYNVHIRRCSLFVAGLFNTSKKKGTGSLKYILSLTLLPCLVKCLIWYSGKGKYRGSWAKYTMNEVKDVDPLPECYEWDFKLRIFQCFEISQISHDLSFDLSKI